MTILFGTAGRPSTSSGDTISGIREVNRLGLDAMELEFVHSIYLKKDKAPEIKTTSKSEKVFLSCHAPYYINLASLDKAKLTASKTRIINSAEVASLAGARDIVFHAGFYMNRPPKEVYKMIHSAIKELSETLHNKKIPVYLRPEIAGKNSVFGSLEEILSLCELPRVLPCIDFAHLHARTLGSYTTQAKFESVFEKIEEKLGKSALQKMHMHVSGIEYGPKGERNHTFLKESDFKHRLLLRALKSWKISGTLICESPTPEADALILKKEFSQL
jgi:deoxyribonuclease IV